MPFKNHKPEEIIGKLREVEIVLAQGVIDGRIEDPEHEAAARQWCWR